MIQKTSLKAFEEIKESLGRRQQEVYDAFKKLGSGTNSMIANELRVPINSVTPRTFELRQFKLVGVSHVDKCPITGRTAIFWKVVR